MLHNLFHLETLSYRLPRCVTSAKQLEPGCYYSVCPRCGATLERDYVNYCDRCGQCLSWILYDFALNSKDRT